jgi:hypothetical protein
VFKRYQRLVDLVWQMERKGLYLEQMVELKEELEKLQSELEEDFKQMGIVQG